MKQFKIILIVLLSAMVVGLIVVMIFLTEIGSRKFSIGNFTDTCELRRQQEIDLTKINTIEINFSSDDIIFYEGNSDKLILKEYGTDDRKDNENAKIKIDEKSETLSIVEGNTLQEYNTFMDFAICNSWGYVEIYLPKDCQKNLVVETSSGEIKAEISLKAEKSITMNSSSGEICLKEVTAEEINANTTSGDITIEMADGNRNIEASSGEVEVLGGDGDSTVSTSSGDITIKNANGSLEVETSSGEVAIVASNCEGSIMTTSGDIDLQFGVLNENLYLSTSSGECNLLIPEKVSFELKADTSSGDITTFFDEDLSYNKKGNVVSGSYGKNSTHTIEIETSSGDVTVSNP